MANERVEAEFTVPASTSVSATNSGGGPTTVTLTAGSSFMTDLCANLQTQLNSSRDPSPGTWSVAMSTSTGLVTIDCTSGDKVTKSGGVDGVWDAGACTSTTIAGNGYVEMTVLETGKYRALGFSVSGACSTNWNTIDYGVYLKGGGTPTEYAIVENGTERVAGLTYAADDKFTVQRTGTVITYYKNGALVYTSLVASSGSLMIDSAYFNSSATMCAIRLYDVATRVALVWGTTTNTTVTALTWSVSWTSTALRDVLGFTANISSVNAPQTGTGMPSGVWFPGCNIVADSHPKQAPTGDDKAASISPTGRVYSIASSEYFRHRKVRFPYVDVTRIWANDATVVGADWETFYLETQLAHNSWFEVGSRVKVFWDNAGVLTELGSGGVDAWRMPECVKLDDLAMSQNGWTGLFDINLGDLYADE